MNRIGRKDFGSFNGKTTIAPSNALDVVKVKRAFSCIGDNNNTNWKAFKPTLNNAAKRACNYAHYMMQNDQESIDLPTGQIPESMNSGITIDEDIDTYEDIVYYHDKTINCPTKWTNKYWKPVLLLETEHFKFYKIVKNEGNES